MAQQGYEVVNDKGERAWWDGKKLTLLGANGAPQGKLTGQLQEKEIADISAMQTSSAMSDMLGGYSDQLNQDKLNLGPVKNLVNRGLNAIGKSTPESRNFASFRASLEKLRNDSLRLNAGVQTEGDAQRAWNELMTNLNDEELVKQRLKEIQDINDRATYYRGMTINQRRAGQNVAPLDTRQFTQGTQRKPFDLSQGQSRSSIPFGAYYKDPQGNLRRNDNGDAGNPIIRQNPLMGPQQAKPQARQASGPRPGMVEDGYRFKGGDPANPQSWERVR